MDKVLKSQEKNILSLRFKVGTTESTEWKPEHDRAVLPEGKGLHPAQFPLHRDGPGREAGEAREDFPSAGRVE